MDVSNSFTKLALVRRGKIGTVRRVPTPALSSTTLRTALEGWEFMRVVLCSVVPDKSKVFRRALRVPLLEVDATMALGVDIDYPHPNTIGPDRLANAAAAAVLLGAPSVVVDFGTAVTFDVLSRDRSYIGGVICPGLQAMTEYLHQRTALLPRIHLLEPPHVIGKSTREAMLSGAVHGYRGLVRQVLHEIRTEVSPRRHLPVVATGGYADLIAAGLPEIDSVRPGLTLEGLRLIAELNPG